MSMNYRSKSEKHRSTKPFAYYDEHARADIEQIGRLSGRIEWGVDYAGEPIDFDCGEFEGVRPPLLPVNFNV